MHAGQNIPNTKWNSKPFPLFTKPWTRLLARYGAQMPPPLQLTVDAHPVCARQSPGVTQAHEVAAIALFGAASEATIGKATIDARPIFLIS
jgi:hypothetical protein